MLEAEPLRAKSSTVHRWLALASLYSFLQLITWVHSDETSFSRMKPWIYFPFYMSVQERGFFCSKTVTGNCKYAGCLIFSFVV